MGCPIFREPASPTKPPADRPARQRTSITMRRRRRTHHADSAGGAYAGSMSSRHQNTLRGLAAVEAGRLSLERRYGSGGSASSSSSSGSATSASSSSTTTGARLVVHTEDGFGGLGSSDPSWQDRLRFERALFRRDQVNRNYSLGPTPGDLARTYREAYFRENGDNSRANPEPDLLGISIDDGPPMLSPYRQYMATGFVPSQPRDLLRASLRAESNTGSTSATAGTAGPPPVSLSFLDHMAMADLQMQQMLAQQLRGRGAAGRNSNGEVSLYRDDDEDEDEPGTPNSNSSTRPDRLGSNRPSGNSTSSSGALSGQNTRSGLTLLNSNPTSTTSTNNPTSHSHMHRPPFTRNSTIPPLAQMPNVITIGRAEIRLASGIIPNDALISSFNSQFRGGPATYIPGPGEGLIRMPSSSYASRPAPERPSSTTSTGGIPVPVPEPDHLTRPLIPPPVTTYSWSSPAAHAAAHTPNGSTLSASGATNGSSASTSGSTSSRLGRRTFSQQQEDEDSGRRERDAMIGYWDSLLDCDGMMGSGAGAGAPHRDGQFQH